MTAGKLTSQEAQTSQETAYKAPQQANVAPIFMMTRQRARAATEKANSTIEEPEHEMTLTFTVPERPVDPKQQRKKRTRPQSNDTKHQTTQEMQMLSKRNLSVQPEPKMARPQVLLEMKKKGKAVQRRGDTIKAVGSSSGP